MVFHDFSDAQTRTNEWNASLGVENCQTRPEKKEHEIKERKKTGRATETCNDMKSVSETKDDDDFG